MVEFEIEAGIRVPDSEIQSERSRIEDALSPIPVALDVEDPSPQVGDLSASLGSGGPPAPDGGGRPSSIPVDAPDEIAVGDADIEIPYPKRDVTVSGAVGPAAAARDGAPESDPDPGVDAAT